jgi:hypothetical protein
MSEANPKVDRPRLHVTEVLYHLVPGQEPVALPRRVNRSLGSGEQAFGPRRLTVGESWERLDCGWVERCAMLSIGNEEDRLARRPSPEQAAALAGRVVEVGQGESFAVTNVVPPGESVRLIPPNLKDVWLRCRQGKAAVVVLAVPE